MKKENITIICSTVIPIFTIGVIAVLLWVFKKEVMEFCKELYGRINNKPVNKCATNICDCNEKFNKTQQEVIDVLNEMNDNNKEIRENSKEIKAHLTNIENAIRNPVSVPKPEIEVDPETLKKLFQDYNNNPDEGMKKMYKYVEDRDEQLNVLKEKQSIEI